MAKQYYQGETFDNVAPDFLHDAEFNDCTFINCRWSGARITACSFLGCTFDRCAWSDVVFSFCQMSDAWLLHCAFPVHCLGRPAGTQCPGAALWQGLSSASSATMSFPAWR